MSTLYTRNTIIPVWLVAFGLFAGFGPLVTLGTSVLLVAVGVVVPVIILFVWQAPPPKVAEVLYRAEMTPKTRG